MKDRIPKKWHTPPPWKAEIGPGWKRIIGMADKPIPLTIYEEGKSNTGFAPGDLEFIVECVNRPPTPPSSEVQAWKSDAMAYRKMLHEAIEVIKAAATSEDGVDGSVAEHWAEVQKMDSPLPAPPSSSSEEVREALEAAREVIAAGLKGVVHPHEHELRGATRHFLTLASEVRRLSAAPGMSEAKAEAFEEMAEHFEKFVVAHGVGQSKDSWVPKESMNRTNDFVVAWLRARAAALRRLTGKGAP
jgi:hypothetical protein